MSHRIRCTFRPQAWVNHDQLIECSPLGPTEWVTTVEALPVENSYESDNLRYAPEAPNWCREWSGPFEVDYEEVSGDEPNRPRYLHYFDVPVTGSFESDEEDSDEALKKRLSGLSPTEAIKSLVDDCQIFHALHNIDCADMAKNPEAIND